MRFIAMINVFFLFRVCVCFQINIFDETVPTICVPQLFLELIVDIVVFGQFLVQLTNYCSFMFLIFSIVRC